MSAVIGLLLALGGSPWNAWPLLVLGLAVLYRRGEERSRRTQVRRLFVTFAVVFLISLSWSRQFSVPGYLLLSLVEALFYAVPLALLPADRSWRRVVAFPAALVLGEFLRTTIPFGGLPMGGLTTGLASSPFAGAASLVGERGLLFLLAIAAVAVVELFRWYENHRRYALLALVGVAAFCAAGDHVRLPTDGTLRAASVQGGGVQGLQREAQDPDGVFQRHLAATADVPTGTQLIVWPENTVQISGSLPESAEGRVLAATAQMRDVTLVAGVVDVQGDRFRNTATVWAPDGTITGAYDKVQRVPFGEYVPFRSLVERVADLSQVPDDAIAGTGPAVVDVAGTRAAVAISYEGLFSRRVLDGVRAGGQLVLVPTNASSYFSPKVARAQVQGARLRARESGRWVIQSSPTGISAIVDPTGRVQQQSSIGPAAVLSADITLHRGLTPYSRFGDAPAFGLSVLLVLAVLLSGRAGRRLWLRSHPGYPD